LWWKREAVKGGCCGMGRVSGACMRVRARVRGEGKGKDEAEQGRGEGISLPVLCAVR